MGGSTIPKVLGVGGLLAATLMGASMAMAQDAPEIEGPPAPVNFSDPHTALDEGRALDLNVRDDSAARFSTPDRAGTDPDRPRRLELELAAGGGDSPVDVSVAQRASLGSNRDGDINRRGRGSEVRIGRNLVQERDSGDRQGSSLYFFAADDDEALTWQPGGARNEFGSRGGSLGYEERVAVGDRAAGITYETNGIQASLAYVERSESTRVGRQSFSQEEAFTGVTVTMRH